MTMEWVTAASESVVESDGCSNCSDTVYEPDDSSSYNDVSPTDTLLL